MTVKVAIPNLFKEQRQAYLSYLENRFLVLNCGRRWGKNVLLTYIIIKELLQGKRVGLWCPDFRMSKQVFRDIYDKLNKNLIVIKSVSALELKLITKGVFQGWHLKDENQGRGEKYHLAVINEAAFSDNLKDIWNDTIRPTLSTKGEEGKAIFMSTPKGENYFYELANIARNTQNWDYQHHESAISPYVSNEEVENAKRELPSLIFRRNYLAVFEGTNENQLIERKDIEQCIRDFSSLTVSGVQIGVDFCGDSINGITINDNAFVVRQNSNIIYYETNKLDQHKYLDYLLQYVTDNFPNQKVRFVLDHIGVGSGTVKHLRQKIKDKKLKNISVFSWRDHLDPYTYTNAIKDTELYFNNTAKMYWLIRRTLKADLLNIVKNKYTSLLIDQFLGIEYEFTSKVQENVIRVYKKGSKTIGDKIVKKSPDLPDAFKYACSESYLKSLLIQKEEIAS